jgi:prepilin-type N-terminal cleavage/methylation domain-containing protein
MRLCHCTDTNIYRKIRGFTLIELSVVLIIIGLLVGGVLVGQNLIASAQLKAAVTQFEKYNQAVNAFRTKYDCLPGDCFNATQFLTLVSPWGNGNGNGQFDDNYSPYPYPTTVWIEPSQFWVHLLTAHLSECCQGAVSQIGQFVIGQQFPQAKLGNAGISVMTLNGKNGYFWGILNSTGIAGWADTCGGQPISYCDLSTPGTAGAITASQAQAFDSKIDDGLATTGNVYAVWLYGGDGRIHPEPYYSGYDCLASNSNYNTSYTGNVCSLFIAF